jgi:hypothetical protein
MKLWIEDLTGRNYLEESHIDRGIISNWTLEISCGRLWTGFIRLRAGIDRFL